MSRAHAERVPRGGVGRVGRTGPLAGVVRASAHGGRATVRPELTPDAHLPKALSWTA
ncbi:hypothetical protein ACWGLB_16190 [Streptomyces sp. NPDC055893]